MKYGKTQIGALSYKLDADEILTILPNSLSLGGRARNIVIYFKSFPGERRIRAGIYRRTNNVKVAETEVKALKFKDPQWNTFSIVEGGNLRNEQYYLALHSEKGLTVYYDESSAYSQSRAFDEGLPETLSPTGNSIEFSIYVIHDPPETLTLGKFYEIVQGQTFQVNESRFCSKDTIKPDDFKAFHVEVPQGENVGWNSTNVNYSYWKSIITSISPYNGETLSTYLFSPTEEIPDVGVGVLTRDGAYFFSDTIYDAPTGVEGRYGNPATFDHAYFGGNLGTIHHINSLSPSIFLGSVSTSTGNLFTFQAWIVPETHYPTETHKLRLSWSNRGDSVPVIWLNFPFFFGPVPAPSRRQLGAVYDLSNFTAYGTLFFSGIAKVPTTGYTTSIYLVRNNVDIATLRFTSVEAEFKETTLDFSPGTFQVEVLGVGFFDVAYSSIMKVNIPRTGPLDNAFQFVDLMPTTYSGSGKLFEWLMPYEPNFYPNTGRLKVRAKVTGSTSYVYLVELSEPEVNLNYITNTLETVEVTITSYGYITKSVSLPDTSCYLGVKIVGTGSTLSIRSCELHLTGDDVPSFSQFKYDCKAGPYVMPVGSYQFPDPLNFVQRRWFIGFAPVSGVHYAYLSGEGLTTETLSVTNPANRMYTFATILFPYSFKATINTDWDNPAYLYSYVLITQESPTLLLDIRAKRNYYSLKTFENYVNREGNWFAIQSSIDLTGTITVWDNTLANSTDGTLFTGDNGESCFKCSIMAMNVPPDYGALYWTSPLTGDPLKGTIDYKTFNISANNQVRFLFFIAQPPGSIPQVNYYLQIPQEATLLANLGSNEKPEWYKISRIIPSSEKGGRIKPYPYSRYDDYWKLPHVIEPARAPYLIVKRDE